MRMTMFVAAGDRDPVKLCLRMYQIGLSVALGHPATSAGREA